MERFQEILNFWFGDPDQPGSDYGQPRQAWFQKRPELDAEIRQRFLTDSERAAAGELDPWQQAPRPCLALILLLDQFPRNLFRGSPRSFAADGAALAVAEVAVAASFDQRLLPVERQFVYLPFEHSEDRHQQQRSVALFQQLVAADPSLDHCLDYARRHRAVIERFGRFPHRNQILGRSSTPEEMEFLQQRGSRF